MIKILKKQLLNISLLALSIFLFSLSFPGFFIKEGIGLLSFIALIPMFLVLFKLNYLEGVAYGFIFGCCKYLLFNYWLKSFDLAAFAVVPIIYGLYFTALFPIIIFLYRSFPKNAYLPISLTWLFYEFFKSTNIVGFSYGILSQSMYKTHLFTGVADVIGSYYLSLLIVFPGVLISFYITKKENKVKSLIIPGIIYLFIMIISSIYTQVSKVDYSNSKTLKVSLIQHNIDSWLNNNSDSYYQAFKSLEELSKDAEELNTDLVVWPETAFTPAIEWHKKYRPSNERERYKLIMQLEDYLLQTDAYYIVGNNESFNPGRDSHHNTAYLYKKNEIIDRYRKIDLVPFTEQFPFPDKLPWLYNYVESLGAKQYMPGEKQNLFNIKGVKSTVLICFEDAFSKLTRESVNNGSDFLINITNDAWTSSTSAALQHLAAATLRTVENRRTLVRAGTTGFTGVIDPNGNVVESLPLFTKGQLTYNVPIYNDRKTFYTKYGHIVDNSCYILFVIVILAAIFNRIFILKRT